MAVRDRRRSVGYVGALVLAGAFILSLPAGSITWGTLDTDHPYVGAILADLSHVRPDLGVIEWCSGTLIAPRVFLTAGHCTVGLDAWEVPKDKIWVSFSQPIFGDEAVLWPIADYVTHPDYWWGWMSDPHDLGVVILQDAVVDVGLGEVAPPDFLDLLAERGTLKGTWFVNVGYGSDERGQVTGWREYSLSEFRNLHKAWLYMSQNIHTGSGGTCYGDSGGPTFYKDGAAEYIVAVTSWGDSECKATNNNYRVDIPASQAFIADMLLAYGQGA